MVCFLFFGYLGITRRMKSERNSVTTAAECMVLNLDLLVVWNIFAIWTISYNGWKLVTDADACGKKNIASNQASVC
jgi:hypothetical protein